MIRAADLPLGSGFGRARMASGSEIISTAHEPSVASPPSTSAAGPLSSSRLLASDASTATRDEIEREHIVLALEAEGGKVEAAARRLGMPRSTLYQRLKTLGLTPGRRPTPRPQREE